MINLFKAKAHPVKFDQQVSAGRLRIMADQRNLFMTKQFHVFYYRPGNRMDFKVSILPDEGYYKGGKFVFSFELFSTYPNEPPLVKCMTKVHHPNIDLEGNVYLNVLREENWNPDLNLVTICNGLLDLFKQPNYDNPLNYEAAAELRDNPELFESNVRTSMMEGGYVGDHSRCADHRGGCFCLPNDSVDKLRLKLCNV